MKKNIGYYLNLPYTIELQNYPDEGWFVSVKELPGCMSQGDTAEEALEMIFDAMQGWLEIALESGQRIPQPRPGESFSGKFVVRVPKSLHRRLVERAEYEGVSLNQYINVNLADSVSDSESISFKKGTDQEPEGKLVWPGLSRNLSEALIKIGLEREAGDLDEDLFTNWIMRIHHSIEEAFTKGYYLDAIKIIEETNSRIDQFAEKKGILESLVASLEFQQQLIEQIVRIQQSMVRTLEKPLLQSNIRTLNRDVFLKPSETTEVAGKGKQEWIDKTSVIVSQINVN